MIESHEPNHRKLHSSAELVNFIRFWPWFFTTGIKSFLKKEEKYWTAAQFALGYGLSLFIQRPLSEIASPTLLPIACMFAASIIGGTNSLISSMSSKEMIDISNAQRTKAEKIQFIQNPLFTHLMSILIMMAAVLAWCLVLANHPLISLTAAGRVLLFTLTGIAVRESWNAAVMPFRIAIIRQWARVIGESPK